MACCNSFLCRSSSFLLVPPCLFRMDAMMRETPLGLWLPAWFWIPAGLVGLCAGGSCRANQKTYILYESSQLMLVSY